MKRYSSGMYVRLAFAVAAHLEPEILIVDEVLAVGDAQFQKKCLGKMGEVAKGGRTVLFVSHNLGAVRRLCTSALLLQSGRLDSSTREVDSAITQYLQTESGTLAELPTWRSLTDVPRDKGNPAVVTGIALEDSKRSRTINFSPQDAMVIVIECKLPSPTLGGLSFSVLISTTDGERITTSFLTNPALPDEGTFTCRCALPPLHLPPGSYWVGIGVARCGQALEKLHQALQFCIESPDEVRAGFLQAVGQWEVIAGIPS